MRNAITSPVSDMGISVAGHDRDWVVDAACRGVDSALFDPAGAADPGHTVPRRVLLAVAFCDDCPVRAQCGADADAHRDEGVRAGLWRTRRGGLGPYKVIDPRQAGRG